MTPERWTQIEELFHRACECNPVDRNALFNEACRDDPNLRLEVEKLLASEPNAKEHLHAAVREEIETVGFPLVGETISHYRILDGLASGGMGLVYRAQDTKLGRLVALKFLPEESAKDSAALGRFEREARAASALEHPNICPIYEFGEHQGQPFLVMQLLDGQTLRELVSAANSGKTLLGLSKVLDLAIQITSGLDAAHQEGVVHRDIKPANIFVTSQGQAKILDFGLAKLFSLVRTPGDLLLSAESDDEDGGHESVRRIVPSATSDLSISLTGVAIGTAGYMSPEQVRGEKLDARTDLFSFGLVLYELATGRRAFVGDTGPGLQDAILNQNPTSARELNPKISPTFARVIHRAIEKDRGRRYQTAGDLRADLESAKQDMQHHRSAPWLVLGGGVLVLAMAILVFWISRRTKPSVVTVSDMKLRQLTSNSNDNPVTSGAISPDGKYLAYTDVMGVHVTLLATGESRIVSQAEVLKGAEMHWELVSWFPDNAKFVVNAIPQALVGSTNGEQSSSIWVMTVLGEGPQKLRDDAVASAISPNGQEVAFSVVPAKSHNREIWVMGVHGEAARRLVEPEKDGSVRKLRWFPAGNRILYFADGRSGTKIMSRDMNDGSIHEMFTYAELEKIHECNDQLALLADGRMLYALPEPEVVAGSCNYWEVMLDSRTGVTTDKPKRLTNFLDGGLSGTAVTTDGKKLTFNKLVRHYEIYLSDLDKKGIPRTNPKRLTFGGSSVYLRDWTKDSNTIIFDSTLGIYKQSLSEQTAHILVKDENTAHPSVTPDGQWIIYLGPVGEQREVLRIPITGGLPLRVATALPGSALRCGKLPGTICALVERTADGKETTFTEIDPFKGRGRELAMLETDSTEFLAWDLSPDGTRICFNQRSKGPIEILSFDVQARREITVKGWPEIGRPRWSADGKSLLVANGWLGATVLLRVSMNGNARVVWQHDGLTEGRSSPDGRHVAMVGGAADGNMWMLENF